MRRLLITLALCSATSPALARSQKTLAYPKAESFETSIRFLRVDEGLKLVEKDVDAGYVLFELHEEKKTFRGSLEVIDVVQDGRHAVRFVLTIADRPEWQENGMLNRLEEKLRSELGAPAPAADKKKPPSDDDAAKKKDPEPNKVDGDEKREKPGDHKDEGPPISPTP
jgi:hypothetical protein